MNHRLGAAALSLALVTSIVAVGTSARAAVDPDDEAAMSIRLTQQDGPGGVHLERSARGKLTKQAVLAVDLTRVHYDIDRVAKVLTVVYRMRHGAVPAPHLRFYYATIATEDVRDYAAPSVALLSRPGSAKVWILDLYSDGSRRRCTGGATVAANAGRAVTATVPFSCLGSVEHSRLWSGVGLERRGGGDVAYDTAHRTRDLPLTAYAPPPAD